MKKVFLVALLVFISSCSAQRPSFSSITEKDGKVGIGTSFPDELLTVKGKIHTQEVLVDLKGAVAPDYVFENYFNGYSLLNPEYTMPSLVEIESFIKKHHHLPKVPSAKEFDVNGMSLKEMSLLLLEKIEELTLYTIEQQKEIDKLKEEISRIKK